MSLLFGVVVEIDAAKVRAKIRFAARDGMVSDWLPVGQRKTLRDRDYHMPDVGEHVAVAMDDRLEDGVVLCAIYSDAAPAPVNNAECRHVEFADGASVDYDRSSHTLTVNIPGPITIVASGPVTIDAPHVTCTGTLTVKGKLTYLGGMAGFSGDGATAVITGHVTVDGDVSATGTVMDGGGNSNHHEH
jgi:phage baseplate assembly protein V